MLNLTVFSHLRWDFVYQRPQHLLTRLARHYAVTFIEEPVHNPGEPHLERRELGPGIRWIRPHTPLRSAGFSAEQLPVLRQLLAPLASEIGEGVAWLYTPLALPLVPLLSPRALVYDCMDELSAFRFAPPELPQREQELLAAADVVFTGGRSLYAARRDRHPDLHCLPSSVDAAHFRQALKKGLDHPAQEVLPHPRLGYYGVLDERLDIALLQTVADRRPDWQFVLAGPTAKIDPASLPAGPNIHWIGPQPYDSLPALLAGWDVALMPFARNEATRYISPTKLLEYLAAERPVVSTGIRDVAEPYGDVVAIADEPPAFVAACERMLRRSRSTEQRWRSRVHRHLQHTSWDRTAERMHALIATALARRRTREAGANVTPLPSSRPRTVPQQSCIVIGAGPTGLSAALHLGEDSLLLERENRVGGWCRSVQDRGFTFDHAGHILFSNDPWVLQMYERLLGDNLHWQDREAWIYSHGVHTRYPFQGALHGLPPKVLKECLLGAIEAHIAAREAAWAAQAGGSVVPLQRNLQASADNFEDFILRTWGRGVARHFALPYNEKLWAVPLREMETSWLAGRVPLPDLGQMIEGALEPVPKPMGPNARFGYPLRGGFQALMDAFLPQIRGHVELNAEVVALHPQLHQVELADGRRLAYGQLISTMPLPALVRAAGEAAPAEVRAAAAALRHVSVRCVNLGIGRERITDKHWIYYPGETVFHRIFVQGNASPHCNPPGGFGLTCEISYSPAKPLPCEGQALIDRCIRDCIAVGMLRPDDPILCAHEVDMPVAYVVYDHGRAENVERIRRWASAHGIVLAGRYAEWEYYNSDHAFLAGRKAAETALAALAGGAAATTGSRSPAA